MKDLSVLSFLIIAFGVMIISSAQTPTYHQPMATVSMLAAPTGICVSGSPDEQVLSTGIRYSCHNVAVGFGTWGQATPSAGAITIALGTGAGTGATYSSSGTDSFGEITITTGTSPVNGGTIATITRENACENGNSPLLRSSNAAAAQLNGTTHEYVRALSGAQWSLTANATGLAASTTYMWSYHDGCY